MNGNNNKAEFLDGVFYGGPHDGGTVQFPAGVTRLTVPVGNRAAIYVWAHRSVKDGWVFEFKGYVSGELQKA